MSDWIDILSTALPISQAIEFVTHPDAGGINIFLGTTRAERSPAHRDLVALDYDAYHLMAMQRMNRLAVEARRSWPIVRLAILHRMGRVHLGEPSVIIAVSCPHRADAFAACRWLIDQLKADVPIWKKEIWADGANSWVLPDLEKSGQ